MKTKTIFSVVAFALMASAYCQQPAIELTFTAINNTAFVQLDHIKVMNRTTGWDTVLYYPDTVLVLDFQVGIHEVSLDKTGLQVFFSNIAYYGEWWTSTDGSSNYAWRSLHQSLLFGSTPVQLPVRQQGRRF